MFDQWMLGTLHVKNITIRNPKNNQRTNVMYGTTDPSPLLVPKGREDAINGC